MKKLLFILFLTLYTLSVYSQTDVFVLVDVSKSVKQYELDNAKQALYEVLTGRPLTKAFIPAEMGKPSDLPKFELNQGDKLSISKFGSLHTTLAINPNPNTILNVNADVMQVLNTIAWTPTDQQTYITLAKAKIAEYAKNHNITKYKLYIISDNINDDYGQGGKPNYPDDYTRNLAEGYNTSTNPVNEAGYTKLKFSANSLFTLSFSPGVDVSKYSLPGGIPPLIVDTDIGNSVITLTSPSKARKGKEHEIKTETLNVNWTCNNCPQGIKYTVLVSQYDGGKFRETKKGLVANTATFKLPDGKFRITVSSSNYSASSDYTHISVNTGSYGWLIFLLLLIAGAVFGYYRWKKIQDEKLYSGETTNTDGIFTNSPNNSNPNSSSNEYY